MEAVTKGCHEGGRGDPIVVGRGFGERRGERVSGHEGSKILCKGALGEMGEDGRVVELAVRVAITEEIEALDRHVTDTCAVRLVDKGCGDVRESIRGGAKPNLDSECMRRVYIKVWVNRDRREVGVGVKSKLCGRGYVWWRGRPSTLLL